MQSQEPSIVGLWKILVASCLVRFLLCLALHLYLSGEKEDCVGCNFQAFSCHQVYKPWWNGDWFLSTAVVSLYQQLGLDWFLLVWLWSNYKHGKVPWITYWTLFWSLSSKHQPALVLILILANQNVRLFVQVNGINTCHAGNQFHLPQ